MFSKVLLTGFAVSALALAQMGGVGSAGPVSPNGSPGRGDTIDASGAGPVAGVPPRPHKETKSDQIVNRLKLNQDQITAFRNILEATAKDSLRGVNQWLRARTTLATAMINGKSQTDLDPLVKAMSDAQFQITGIELTAFQKIDALLRPNQTANAPEAFDLMAGIFEPQLADLDAERRGSTPAPAAPNKLEAIATTLNLSKDQKKAVKTILDDGAKEAAPVRDRVSKSRVAVGEAVVAKKSAGEIQQAAKTSSEFSTQLTQVELNAFAKIVAALDNTQKANRQGMGRVLILVNHIYGNKNWNAD